MAACWLRWAWAYREGFYASTSLKSPPSASDAYATTDTCPCQFCVQRRAIEASIPPRHAATYQQLGDHGADANDWRSVVDLQHGTRSHGPVKAFPAGWARGKETVAYGFMIENKAENDTEAADKFLRQWGT